MAVLATCWNVALPRMPARSSGPAGALRAWWTGRTRLERRQAVARASTLADGWAQCNSSATKRKRGGEGGDGVTWKEKQGLPAPTQAGRAGRFARCPRRRGAHSRIVHACALEHVDMPHAPHSA